jgi:hypothetical protein
MKQEKESSMGAIGLALVVSVGASLVVLAMSEAIGKTGIFRGLRRRISEALEERRKLRTLERARSHSGSA